MGSENPPQEDWDYYNRYVGPNQQAKAKARAAAPTPVSGVATAPTAVPKVSQQTAAPKQPAVPPSGWQPILRSAEQPVQQAEYSSVHISASVRSVPKPVQGVTTVTPAKGSISAPPSLVTKVAPKVELVVSKPLPVSGQSQGVVAHKKRDTTAVASEVSSSAPSSVVAPETPKVEAVVTSLPKSDQSQGVAVPKERDTAVVTSKESSTAHIVICVVPKVSQGNTVVKPLPTDTFPSPPDSPPPSPPIVPPSSIPPPPQHPPPTLEELTAQASSAGQAREAVVDSQGPVGGVEGGQVESEVPETTLGETHSPRERHPKRERPTSPPLPVNLLSRVAREQIELANELRASGYPGIRLDSAGTWVRVAGPLVATAADTPSTRPLVVPKSGIQQVGDVDPHHLDDAVWRDPSLSSRRVILATNNLQSSDIVNFADQDADTEEEGAEHPLLAAQRFEQTGRDFIARAKSSSVNPIEAEPFETVPQPSKPPPPKRQKVTIKITSKDSDPKAVTPSPTATSESSIRFPRDIIPPWRKLGGSAAEAPKSLASGVAAISGATSDTAARSRPPRASPSIPPKAAQNSSSPVVLKPRTSNKIGKE